MNYLSGLQKVDVSFLNMQQVQADRSLAGQVRSYSLGLSVHMWYILIYHYIINLYQLISHHSACYIILFFNAH